ncbi:hypothetical protein OPW13_12475 [Vibrio europaeus]|uniref:Uncharacterized protein n=1 Tax=Vibrio europaeus TaxID=300876 RepID=A0A178JB87_9VIBR|nr:hypothetical protein [Vibrio europaeus]MDC5704673.1 hypothetical protein [Vibrio europaeus]MDC5711587.1 hypothetical protein [Vibrio europaeus]MDC5713502.1 hypothetical protein [Vibrio europaeus]MDC5843401.1 hypothetical protein [Vibrio europaeus]MDC5860036.1 hypothetical protein [Vibrio europaeus]
MLVGTRLRYGQVQELQAIGRYLMLKEGELVSIVANDKAVEAPRGYVFDMQSEFTSIRVTNLSNMEEIEILTSDIPFTAGVDGSRLGIMANLEVSDFTVGFKERQPVSLPSDQKVVAELANFPAVLPVNVENQIALPEVQKVHVVQQSEPNLRYVPHETMTATGTITGNVNRKELILKAGDSNQSSIWLGGVADRGYEMRAGEGFILSNGAQLEVLIPSNCKLYVSEVTV